MVARPRLGALSGRGGAALLLEHQPRHDPPGLARAGASPRRALLLMLVATPACPLHVVGKRIVDDLGQAVYRAPRHRVVSWQAKCSGRTVWVLFHGGVASSQESYIGVRSGDGGRTWKLLLSAPYFGVRAPFTIDSYSGPWTIVGENAAYFVGWCPSCGRYGTVSLTVTLNAGMHFPRYRIAKLAGFRGTGIRVIGDVVTITARNQSPIGPRTRTITIKVH